MKKLGTIVVIVVVCVALVYAVTLTKEATDRVEIDTAIRGQLCKESDCGEVIAGLGTVFGKTKGVRVDYFLMISFDGNIYRDITSYYVYNETTKEMTSISGKCSVLDPQAEYGERQITCRYMIEVSKGEITNLILNFDHYNEDEIIRGQQPIGWIDAAESGNYRLVSIEDTVSGIVWKPGEAVLQ